MLSATLIILLTPWIAAAGETSTDAEAAAEEFFEKRIRPTLVQHCFECHDDGSNEGELQVDSLGELLRGGTRGPAIVPGKPEESLLIRAINHGELLKMPPKYKLATSEIKDLAQWIRNGAVWPNADPVAPVPKTAGDTGPLFTDEQRSHWAFQPVTLPTLPVIRHGNWITSPIDHFVLARLESAKLSPAPQAEKRLLIRRATYDLTGLPPTPGEIEAFLGDASPNAFNKVLDRLLGSPHYGERWGRHWLDVARYADSNGMDENLAYVSAFRYRDYVIAALNDDKPYNQFVQEQLAGDLCSYDSLKATHDAIKATGFLSIGPKFLAEDDPLKMQMDIIDEQVDTIGKVFMGMTLGCARCHDHKFDPIPTVDYYSLFGIMKSTKTMENFNVVAAWREHPLTTPELAEKVAATDQLIADKKSEFDKLNEAATRQLLEKARKQVVQYLLLATHRWQLQTTASYGADKRLHATPGLQLLEAEQYDRGNVLKEFKTYGQGIGVLINAGQTPNFAEYDVEVEQAGLYQFETRYAAAEARPCVLTVNGKTVDSSIVDSVTGSWYVDGQKWFVEGVLELQQGKNTLRIEQAQFVPHIDKLLIVPIKNTIHDMGTFAVTMAEESLIPSIIDHWVEYLKKTVDDPESLLAAWHHRVAGRRQPFKSDQAGLAPVQGDLQSFSLVELAELYQQHIFDPALSAHEQNPDSQPEDRSLAAAVELLHGKTSPFILPDNPIELFPADTMAQVTKIQHELKEVEALKPEVPQTMAVTEGQIADARVQIRGSYLTEGEVAPRRFLRVIAGEDQQPIDDDRSGRLEFARWLSSAEHPLTSRVMVNRIWHWHFGAGIVRSPDNFGKLGARPTHPDLLDWLATYFTRDARWSLKAMHRMIMLSSTYQMGTRYNKQAIAVDPDNRFLWRKNRRRMTAEEIRDSILATSERLDLTMGGSLLTTKPRQYVTSTSSVDTVTYESTKRAVYLPVIRSALYNVFQAFDFAEPSVINGQRSSTTLASQALFMMNSRLVSDSAQQWAEDLLAHDTWNDPQRIAALYTTALGRPPTNHEFEEAVKYIQRFIDTASTLEDHSGGNAGKSGKTEEQIRLWAWGSYCRAVLSSNEFVYIE